jgi:aminoglycoside phosphotransferase (APT) family kinase protein
LTISGLIDLDHAALGDPAIDVAPLLGQFGAVALADAVSPTLMRRAMLHRATLSLQVAAAADLCGDEALRNFALSNFNKRYAAGTLYEGSVKMPRATSFVSAGALTAGHGCTRRITGNLTRNQS